MYTDVLLLGALKQTQSLPLGTFEYRAPGSELSLYLLFALGLQVAYNKTSHIQKHFLLSNVSMPPV